MIKAKFWDAALSKSDTGQMYEALCKVLTHNICCVIRAIHEIGSRRDLLPPRSLGHMGSSRSRRREETRRKRPLPKATDDRDANYAPFGDVSFYGAPMPSEMHNGWRWYRERLRMINLRGAALYVALACAGLLVAIVIGVVFI